MTAPTGTIHIPSNGICEENRDSKMHVLAHNASCKSYKSYKSGGGGGGVTLHGGKCPTVPEEDGLFDKGRPFTKADTQLKKRDWEVYERTEWHYPHPLTRRLRGEPGQQNARARARLGCSSKSLCHPLV